jgi:uncharacterized lipoprotein YehR (DUF1307 family)
MKRIKKNLAILSLVTLTLSFTACNQSATSVLNKEPIFGQNLQYTKVAKIVIDKEVQALVNITYLNSVDSKAWDNDKQNFLVGTYIAEETKATYTLTMNGNKEISTSKVPQNDKIFENIALKNNWASYQITTFDDTKETKLELVFKDSLENNATISFIKE